jgi:hypothetical protein
LVAIAEGSRCWTSNLVLGFLCKAGLWTKTKVHSAIIADQFTSKCQDLLLLLHAWTQAPLFTHLRLPHHAQITFSSRTCPDQLHSNIALSTFVSIKIISLHAVLILYEYAWNVK